MSARHRAAVADRAPKGGSHELAFGVGSDACELLPRLWLRIAEGRDDRGTIGVGDESEAALHDVVRNAALVLAEVIRHGAAVAEDGITLGSKRWQKRGCVLNRDERRPTFSFGAAAPLIRQTGAARARVVASHAHGRTLRRRVESRQMALSAVAAPAGAGLRRHSSSGGRRARGCRGAAGG